MQIARSLFFVKGNSSFEVYPHLLLQYLLLARPYRYPHPLPSPTGPPLKTIDSSPNLYPNLFLAHPCRSQPLRLPSLQWLHPSSRNQLPAWSDLHLACPHSLDLPILAISRAPLPLARHHLSPDPILCRNYPHHHPPEPSVQIRQRQRDSSSCMSFRQDSRRRTTNWKRRSGRGMSRIRCRYWPPSELLRMLQHQAQ